MPAETGAEVKEIFSQQVLQDDGSVYSVQWAIFPPECFPRITSRLLLERYLRHIRESTHSLIHPKYTPRGLDFRLLGLLPLLSFGLPNYADRDGRDEARLAITGGILVQRGESEGLFVLSAESSNRGVEVKVELDNFCPLLLGSRSPSLLRRLLYKFTQASIHEKTTVKYIALLYREVAGLELRARVKKVKVRQGREI